MAIVKELGYSQATADLIERMCRNVERRDFVLDKRKAEDCLLRTYDLFGLPRPKKIQWEVDPFTDKYARSAGSARNAWNAGSAGSAWSAGNAWNAGSVGNAGNARSAWNAWNAGSTGSARSAWNAWNAWSAGSAGNAWSAWSAGNAWSALDYDFDWYIFDFEYCQNPDSDLPPNENDLKYLEYCELLMRAKEAGAGYRVEWEDTLYIAPTPLVEIDERNAFHSLENPAIRWIGGSKYYYIHGVNLDRPLWQKVVSGKLTGKEYLNIKNDEQRMVALKMMREADPQWFFKQTKAELVHKSERGNELYIIKGMYPDFPEALYARYFCPSTNREYITGVDPELKRNADHAVAWICGLTPKEYSMMEIES